MKRLILFLSVVALCAHFHEEASAQDVTQPSPIIFIYDASGSMWGQLQGTAKIQIASEVLTESVNKLPANQPLGLVAYGHREVKNCRDVEFLVEVNSGNSDRVTTSLASIKPLGRTPLAYSAALVINRLRESGNKATVILITDGIESCDGNICEVVRSAREEGIDFRLHIVGFGLQGEETTQLRCAAKAGGGKYYDANDAGALSSVLNEATEATIDDPLGNFSVFAVKNGEPIDAVVKAYKAGTDRDVDGVRTYADTSLLYLPPGFYDLEVRPLATDVQPLKIANVESLADSITHKTISFDGAKLLISTLNNEEGWDTIIKVLSADGVTAAGARSYGRPTELEVNPGIYDIQLQALAMNGLQTSHKIEKVALKPGEVTKLEHRFATGIAMIGARSGEGLVDATVSISETNTNKGVAGGRTYTTPGNNPRTFVLNPGTYTVTMRSLGEHAGIEKIFTLQVNKGETVEKIIEF